MSDEFLHQQRPPRRAFADVLHKHLKAIEAEDAVIASNGHRKSFRHEGAKGTEGCGEINPFLRVSPSPPSLRVENASHAGLARQTPTDSSVRAWHAIPAVVRGQRTRRASSLRIVALLAMIMGIVVALAVGFAPRPVQEASLAQIETKLLPTNLQPITPSNIDRLEIVATFGEGILNTAGWSPDGETIAAGGARGVWLMDADDPTQNELLTAGDAGISSVAYSPDGATLAAGDYAGGITFFDTVSRRRMMTAPPPEEGYAIQQLGWLDDTRLAVITLRVSQGIQGLTYHPMLWMFDLSSSEPAWSRLEDVPLAIDASFAIGSSFAHIAYWTGSEDGGRLILLDLPTGERRTLATYTNGVQAITFSHDGGTLYAAHEFGIDRWDMATGEQLETLPNLRTYLFARYVAISPDGRYLTVADTNITIAVYDLTSGEIVYESEAGPYSAFPVMLSFSPDGSQYVCVTTNGLYFNTVAGDAPREYLTHQNGVSALALDEAGQTLAALEWGEGQPPRLWDLATGEDRQLTFERPPDDYYYSASTVDLSGDGSLLLTATGRYVTLIDTVTGEMTWQERATDAVGAAFAREDQDVFIFDQGENEIRIVGSQPRRRENSLVFQGTVLAGMASDTMFATGLARTSTEGRQVGVVVWETGTHISRNALSVGNVDVDGLAFNADGSLLAIATSDLGERPIPQTIRVMLWDWGRDHLITLEDSLYEGTGEISQLAVSGDGALVYGLSNVDGVLRVWDTESLGSVATIDSTAHGWALTSLVLSSDERMLITGGYDGLTRVWGVRG